MTACPEKELLLHALADNELDAAGVLEVEAHVGGCRACADELAAIRKVKAALTEAQPSYSAPPEFRARLEAALAAAAEAPRPARRGLRSETWVLGAGAAAIAASVAFVILAPTGPSLQAQLVEAQARSLQASHLVDVQTSDRHTVKPWFNGKIDFAPPVTDLATQGYPLVGGRLDHVAGRPVAALVFRRRAHVINLFIWPGEGPRSARSDVDAGYNLVSWGEKGLTFWAVSDIDAADLQNFQKAYAAATR
jgi:anti-sigma factor RsiW